MLPFPPKAFALQMTNIINWESMEWMYDRTRHFGMKCSQECTAVVHPSEGRLKRMGTQTWREKGRALDGGL
jgi:hypothetical protein